jgi:hypothetical protein
VANWQACGEGSVKPGRHFGHVEKSTFGQKGMVNFTQ